LIVHMLVFGVDETRRVAPPGVLRALAAIGVLLYGGTGLASFAFGANYLDYNVLGGTPAAGQYLGILLVELGVCITVSSTMALLSLVFAERVRS
jgi:multicomponent Na+:H+ antiporter subunit B